MLKNITLFTLISLTLLSGCATNSARQVHRTSSGDNLSISGQAIAGYLTLNINGEMVINSVSLYSNDIRGTYKNYKVSAKCKVSPKLFGSDQDCDVYIDQEYAANLFFR